MARFNNSTVTTYPAAAAATTTGDARGVVPSTRGLHSSTLQLNLSALCVTGGAVRGCFEGV